MNSCDYQIASGSNCHSVVGIMSCFLKTRSGTDILMIYRFWKWWLSLAIFVEQRLFGITRFTSQWNCAFSRPDLGIIRRLVELHLLFSLGLPGQNGFVQTNVSKKNVNSHLRRFSRQTFSCESCHFGVLERLKKYDLMKFCRKWTNQGRLCIIQMMYLLKFRKRTLL